MTRSLIRTGSSTDAMFELDVGRTAAGSVRLRVKPRRPLRSFYGHERRVAAFVYALAAELEQRAGSIDVRWAISPDPFNAKIEIEVVDENESDAALEFVMEALIELELDSLVIK